MVRYNKAVFGLYSGCIRAQEAGGVGILPFYGESRSPIISMKTLRNTWFRLSKGHKVV